MTADIYTFQNMYVLPLTQDHLYIEKLAQPEILTIKVSAKFRHI